MCKYTIIPSSPGPIEHRVPLNPCIPISAIVPYARDTESRAQQALEKLGCLDFIERRMGELSGGQRKRVALAAALIEAPDMLILVRRCRLTSG